MANGKAIGSAMCRRGSMLGAQSSPGESHPGAQAERHRVVSLATDARVMGHYASSRWAACTLRRRRASSSAKCDERCDELPCLCVVCGEIVRDVLLRGEYGGGDK